MEMRDGLAGVRAVVDHEAEAVGELELFREELGNVEEMTEDRLVVGRRFAGARNEFFRDDEQVDGRLRLVICRSFS